PSEYFKRQCYLALDADEEPAVDVVEKLGADYFVVSTDYPHPDGAFPEAMNEFLALPLDDAARRKILWDNCARLYDIPKPAAPLTRAAPSAAPGRYTGPSALPGHKGRTGKHIGDRPRPPASVAITTGCVLVRKWPLP